MPTTDMDQGRIQPSRPSWIWPVLLAGSVLLLVCGVFVLSFRSEPSAVGRTGAVLIALGAASIATAILGAIAAMALRTQARWATSVAWLASVLMILTCVSSWAGVIAMAGLFSGRTSRKT
ncbi:MAG: hypothetical protein ACREOM_15450 [Candidatus Dormibacteraceae bacterium]